MKRAPIGSAPAGCRQSPHFGVPVAFFFEQVPGGGTTERRVWRTPECFPALEYCSSPEGLQLDRAFVKIRDLKVRRRLLDLVKSLSDEEFGESVVIAIR